LSASAKHFFHRGERGGRKKEEKEEAAAEEAFDGDYMD
jgi:hypothetical protein